MDSEIELTEKKHLILEKLKDEGFWLFSVSETKSQNISYTKFQSVLDTKSHITLHFIDKYNTIRTINVNELF